MLAARLLLAVTLAACAAACGPAIPPLPSLGGPRWYEITSAHFTMWTDAPLGQGHELVRKMEHHYQVITHAMSHPRGNTRSFVIALRDDREAEAYLPKLAIASAWQPSGPICQPGIVISAAAKDRDHVFSHELTHVISFGIIANQPHWLSEGIATYFEMAELDPGETSVQIGIPREDRSKILRVSQPLAAKELFACSDPSCMDGHFYATSWALVSYLLNEHFDQLTRYFQLLNLLPRDQADRAWAIAFPDLPPKRVDRELSLWLERGQVHLPRIEVPSMHDAPARDRPLSDADALAARSLLQALFTQNFAATLSEVNAALAADPTNVLARLVEVAINQHAAPDAARATAAAHPDDWRAWWLVAFALRGSDEGEAARRKLCGMTDQQPEMCARQAPATPPTPPTPPR